MPLGAARHPIGQESEGRFYARRHRIKQQSGLAMVGRDDRPRDKRLIDIALEWRRTRRLRTLYHTGIASQIN